MNRARSTAAGAAAALVWAAAEQIDRQVFANDYTDVALLGKFVTRSRAWPVAGTALHAANGAAFGFAFDVVRRRMSIPPRRLALGLALAEHLAAVPARRAGRPLSPGARRAGSRARVRRPSVRAGDGAARALRGRARPARRVIELDVPVVQAPLAGGPSTPELAAAVSNAGGLGFVAAGYLSADALAGADPPHAGADRRAVRGQPLRAARRPGRRRRDRRATPSELAGEAERYGVALGEPRFDDDEFAAKLDLVVAERVPVVSTTFACPPPQLVERVHGAGGEVWATVTSAAEATRPRQAGVDALVVQGAEAGGHRGSWTDDDGPDLPLLELLCGASTSRLPLVAAGGIADAAGAAPRWRPGATAVQAGTAFLLCPEAATMRAAPPRDRRRRRDGDDAGVHGPPRTRDRQRVHARASRTRRAPTRTSTI